MGLLEDFKKKKLLTDGKFNTKTAKNSLPTYYLSLQPTNLNSKSENLCKFSTKECRKMCLQYAGRQSFSNVVKSRTNKTELFVNHRREFLDKLWGELVTLESSHKKCAVRLNLLSDINWEKEFNNIGKTLKDIKKIQFYDYTKDHMKLASHPLPNYHFTLSYSGHNWKECDYVLKNNIANVAVVFKNSLPLTYNAYPVINADVSDERFLDPSKVIAGLKYKTPKGVKYDPNKFVVDI